MGLHDIHAHLTDPRLVPHETAILERALRAGIGTIVSNGLNLEDNLRVLELARRSPLVKPAIGLYPVDAVLPEMEAQGIPYPRRATVHPEDTIAWVEQNLDAAVAIGEIGLDHHWVPQALWDVQEARFRRLVRLAMDADLPIIVHSRRAERRTFEVLSALGARRVVWHCFGSKVKLGQRIAAAGHWLSIPAHVRRAQNLHRLLETLPRDKILLETDCPYLSPDRGADNEPANVARTAAFAAELWGEPLPAVTARLEANFEAVMGFAP